MTSSCRDLKNMLSTAQLPARPNAEPYTDAEVWNACREVLAARSTPLEVRNVSEAADMPEEDIIGALIRESGPRREAVIFRFPPRPCAAIIAIGPITFIRPPAK